MLLDTLNEGNLAVGDFVAEAAAIDLEAFTWQVFTRKTSLRTQDKSYHQKHTLVLNYGDVYGTLQTRKSIQLVKANALHVLFRGIPASLYERMMKTSIVYKGKTPAYELEDGFQRAKRVATKPIEVKSKSRLEDYFKPVGKIVEKSTIDLANYQWRKVTKSLRLTSKKTGKTKSVLSVGEVIGIRFQTPSEGGYVMYDSDKRVMVSYQHLTDIQHMSSVLPLSRQRDGEVDLPTGRVTKTPASKPSAVTRRKPSRPTKEIPPMLEEAPIIPKYDLSEISEADILVNERKRNNSAKRKQNVIDRVLTKLPDVPEVLDDSEEEFEDEVQPIADSPTVNERSTDKEEQDDTPDTEEEDVGDEEEDEDDSELADFLEPGAMFTIGKRTFAVVLASIMERNENLMEYSLFDTDSDESDLMLYRLRLPANYMVSEFKKHVELLDEEFDAKALAKIQDKSEYAEYKNLPLVK